jgi:lysosomal Pro-X carboxypeptidase
LQELLDIVHNLVLRTYIYICVHDSGKVEAIPDLLDTAVVYGAMMDYPTAAGFLTPLPAHPVRAMCRAIDHPSSGAADVLSRVRDAIDVYYNHSGATRCFGAAEDDDPYGMFSGWNWQARTEMVLMTAGVRDGGVLPPAPFNFTELLDEGRNYTGLPPRPYWIETEFGGFVSLGLG